MKYDNHFDDSLKIGLAGEQLMKIIAQGYIAQGENFMEMKNDQKINHKGNIYIERKSRGRISGIDDSRVPYWGLILDGPEYMREVIVVIKRERLLQICQRLGWGNVPGGDSDTSRGYLVPVEQLVKPLGLARLFPRDFDQFDEQEIILSDPNVEELIARGPE